MEAKDRHYGVEYSKLLHSNFNFSKFFPLTPSKSLLLLSFVKGIVLESIEMNKVQSIILAFYEIEINK